MESSSGSESDNAKDSDWDSVEGDGDTTLKAIEFDIEFDLKSWDKIKPIQKLYRDNRIYDKLKGNWTDIVADKI